MTTITLSELETFQAVVQHGSFTAAAEAMVTDKAWVSRTVSRLEAKLGSRLLDRSTRSLSVTEVGRDVFERGTAILSAVVETEDAVARQQGKPTGVLRLTAGPDFGALAVSGWVAAYLRQHPEMRVAAEFTSRVVDVIHEGFDLAIRVGPLSDSELSARSIGVLRFALYAGPDYLEKHGHPAEPTDLKRHRRIAYGPSGDGPWRLYRGDATATVETSPIAISDSSHMALTLAREGLGVVLLPRMLADPHVAQGRLVPILGGWSRIPVPVQAVFASSRYMAPKVRAFIDLAVAEFRGQRDEDGDTSAPPSSV